MLPYGSVGEELVAFREDLAEGREIERIENFKTGSELPGGEEGNDANNTQPVGERCARALPEPIRRKRVGSVNRNEIGSVLFLFCRGNFSWLTASDSMWRRVELSRRARRAALRDVKSQISDQNL
jgi:hypothetical protein